MCIFVIPVIVLLILYCRFWVYKLLLKNVLSDKFFVINIKKMLLLRKKMKVAHICGAGAIVGRKAFSFDD